jgi:hypothetical protein
MKGAAQRWSQMTVQDKQVEFSFEEKKYFEIFFVEIRRSSSSRTRKICQSISGMGIIK